MPTRSAQLTTQEQEFVQEEAEYLTDRFVIAPERLAGWGRSFQLLLLHRRCASCWGTLIQEPGQGMNVTVAQHLRRIASQCSTTSDFIKPEMPVMEAVFRVLLGERNKSKTVEELFQLLREQWSDPTNPRTPTPATLHRLLTRDTYYGFALTSE
jgi:hypothetical protein